MHRLFRIIFWSGVALTLFITLRPLTVFVPGSDKLHHAMTFGALALLAAGAYSRVRLFPLGAALSGLGAFIEIAQPFFGRSDDVLDWIADTIGIAVALALVWTGRTLLSRRRNSAF